MLSVWPSPSPLALALLLGAQNAKRKLRAAYFAMKATNRMAMLIRDMRAAAVALSFVAAYSLEDVENLYDEFEEASEQNGGVRASPLCALALFTPPPQNVPRPSLDPHGRALGVAESPDPYVHRHPAQPVPPVARIPRCPHQPAPCCPVVSPLCGPSQTATLSKDVFLKTVTATLPGDKTQASLTANAHFDAFARPITGLNYRDNHPAIPLGPMQTLSCPSSSQDCSNFISSRARTGPCRGVHPGALDHVRKHPDREATVRVRDLRRGRERGHFKAGVLRADP